MTPRRGIALLAVVLLFPLWTDAAQAADKRRDERRAIEPRRDHRAVVGRSADVSIPAIVSTCVCEDRLAEFDVLPVNRGEVVVQNSSSHRVRAEVTVQYSQFRWALARVNHETQRLPVTLEPHSHTNVRFISMAMLVHRAMGFTAAVRILDSETIDPNPGNNSHSTNSCDSYVF